MKLAIATVLLPALLLILVAPADANILYSEDFSTGDIARVVWDESPNPTFFDASSGDYVLTQPDGETPVFSFVTGVPEILNLTDTSVRAQVGLTGSSEGAAVFARGGPVTYQGGFEADSKQLYLGWNDPGFNLFNLVDFEYDLNAEDLVLQLDVIGSELALWAWRPGDGKPAQPQLTYTDNANLATSGRPGILHDPASPGTSSTLAFRYFLVADSSIPEPSTICMALAVGSVLMCLRPINSGGR